MKTVFSNKMCAHVWAQQSQLGGRSDHMRFDGPTLYSYSTPIGFIPNGAKYGRRVLLLAGSRMRSMEYFTSSAPNGWPLWNRMPCRSLKV